MRRMISTTAILWRVLLMFILGFSLLACGDHRSVSKQATVPTITNFKPGTPPSVQLLREELVGWWYGDHPTKEGGRNQWIIQRAGDGTFKITFRMTDVAGKITEQTEVGEWGANANFYIALTKGWLKEGELIKASTADAFYWDIYEVISLEGGNIKYRAVESKNEYHAKKVQTGFEFPK